VTRVGTNANQLPAWIEVERSRRERLRAQYEQLFEQVSAALFALDPIGINFEDNSDEYDSEAGTIVSRLAGCRSVEEVQKVVHEEFVRWFGDDVAGEMDRYRGVAEGVLAIWERGGRADLKQDPC